MGQKFKFFAKAVLALTLMVGAIGCGDSKKRIVLLTNGQDPFWEVVYAGMKKAAKDLKFEGTDYVVEIDNNDGTTEGQIEALNQYLNQGNVVAVAVSVKDVKNSAIAKAMKRLQKAGIKVITVDSDIDRKEYRDCRFAYIGTDNIIAGRELGKAAKALRPGGGNYTSYAGFNSAANVVERVNGFGEGAGEKFKKLAPVYEDKMDKTVAASNVRDSIGNFPGKIDIFLGVWAYNAHAIAKYIKKVENPRKSTIVVFDAAELALDDMDEKMIDAMMVQNPYQMGEMSVKLLKALIDDDQEFIKKMYPTWKPGTTEFSDKNGDLYSTELRVVVPDENSPIKPEIFDKDTKFFTIKEFRKWLEERNLKSS